MRHSLSFHESCEVSTYLHDPDHGPERLFLRVRQNNDQECTPRVVAHHHDVHGCKHSEQREANYARIGYLLWSTSIKTCGATYAVPLVVTQNAAHEGRRRAGTYAWATEKRLSGIRAFAPALTWVEVSQHAGLRAQMTHWHLRLVCESSLRLRR